LYLLQIKSCQHDASLLLGLAMREKGTFSAMMLGVYLEHTML